MKKADVLKALSVSGSRVFARVIWGHADRKALVRSVEQTKKDIIETIKQLPDDAEFGVNVSKSGHVYINGLAKAEAMEFGEPTTPETAAAQ